MELLVDRRDVLRSRVESGGDNTAELNYVANWRRELAALEWAMAAAVAVDAHNAECVRLCDDRKRCGYESYRSYMSCSNCPKDWMLDYPSSAALERQPEEKK